MPSFTLLEQLQHLKAMTVRTGSIHEAQALQIRNYPKLLTGVVSVSANVDIENKLVTYNCKVKKGFRFTEKNKIMCGNISIWLRTLLWDSTSVTFTAGKRVLFNSRSAK